VQPIRSIEAAACKALRGVVFDVDDTLTRDGVLEPEAYAALFRLRASGLALIAVTGRPLGFAEIIARMFPVALAIGENGAGWVRVADGQLITGYVDSATDRAAQRVLLERVRERVARDAPWAQLTDDSWARRCDLTWDIGERVHVEAERVAALCALIEREGARAVVSSVHAHAFASACDKARGVVQACRVELGADLDAGRASWLFVGDSANDTAAFAHFPLSAGVANVREHLAKLPVAPRYVSQADRGRGFAEIADVVLELRSHA
jgi:HAD superfamily hydrolase (TIGR01484 family)